MANDRYWAFVAAMAAALKLGADLEAQGDANVRDIMTAHLRPAGRTILADASNRGLSDPTRVGQAEVLDLLRT